MKTKGGLIVIAALAVIVMIFGGGISAVAATNSSVLGEGPDQTENVTSVNVTPTPTPDGCGGPARMIKQEFIERIDSRGIDTVNSTEWLWCCDKTAGFYNEDRYGHLWKIFLYLNENLTVTTVTEVRFMWVYEDDGEFECQEISRTRYWVGKRAIEALVFLPEPEPEPELIPMPTVESTQMSTPILITSKLVHITVIWTLVM